MIYFLMMFIFLSTLTFSDENGVFLENPKENLEKISENGDIKKDDFEKVKKKDFLEKRAETPLPDGVEEMKYRKKIKK